MTFIWVTIMGMLGVWSRFFADLLFNKTQSGFPLSTFLVNILGCFLIGIIINHPKIDPPLRTGLAIGFCGGLTTFSSFVWQVNDLSFKNIFLSGAYFFVSLVFGLMALKLGQRI